MSGGLDVRALQALRTTGRDLDEVRRRIRGHIDRWEGYLPFSGGKDSLVVLDLARSVAPDVPVAFFDSGLEFPETLDYIDRLARDWRLNLHVIPARPGALEILSASGAWDHRAARREGAPGAAGGDLFRALIAEPAAAAHRAHGPGELWGVRAAESRGRAAAYANALRAADCRCGQPCQGRQRRSRHGGVISRADGTVAYGPVWDWHDDEVWGHIHRRGLPVNPVYDKLRRIGAPGHFLRVSAMVDGTRLEEGRMTWLRRGWPALFEELAGALPRIREFV